MPGPPDRLLTTGSHRADRRLTVIAAGELDHRTAAGLSDEVHRLLAPDDREVWLDLSAITACGGAGVIALLGLRHYIGSRGGVLTIAEPSTAVHRALVHAGGLDRLKIVAHPARTDTGATCPS
jgi:anti-anti-sigma factor